MQPTSRRASGAGSPLRPRADIVHDVTGSGRWRELEEGILDALRRAGEPVREAWLYERVVAAGIDASPEEFLTAAARLETLGNLHWAFDHETPGQDPDPFQPRYLRLVR